MSGDGDTRKVIKVGSRKSELALIQTKHVISLLQKLFPTVKFEIHTMTTVGDRVLDKSLPKIGEKSLFTKDLEEALKTGGVDFVVHSLKDLPTQLPHGMTIGAVLERDDPRDALVLNEKFSGHKLKDLPPGSLIGTSSLRRSAQLARNYSHLKVRDIRGNLNTRLAKLDALTSEFSGIILANAGLVRMGWMKRVSQIIEPSELLFAIGQGALAVECRVNDTYVLRLLNEICDLKTQCRILAERSFLKTLGGGCSAPVGTNTVISENSETPGEFSLKIDGAVWSLDGKEEIMDHLSMKFTLEDEKKEDPGSDDDLEVSPSKRPKLSEDQIDNLKRSPEVIDESSYSRDGKNISELVNIHENVLRDVCPYSGKSLATPNKKSNESSGEGCSMQGKFDPLKLPIGQDFMGECPVLNTEQKVSYEGSAAKDKAKCPIAGKEAAFDNKDIEKCPYLNKQVELIDYEENAKKSQKIAAKSLIDDIEETRLYCGIFCHKESHRDAFNKCEEIGINLANKLISAGALVVMKAAQDEIHSKC